MQVHAAFRALRDDIHARTALDQVAHGRFQTGGYAACAEGFEYNLGLLREYAFLIAHSMLHLFGYDHMEEVERKEMEMHQKKIMELVNITR